MRTLCLAIIALTIIFVEINSIQFIPEAFASQDNQGIYVSGPKLVQGENNPCTAGPGMSCASTNIELPLEQFKSGIAVKDIQCKDPLILVMSIHGTPACLNAVHLTILYSRGWVKDIMDAEKLFQLLPDTMAMNFFPPLRANASVLIDKDINTISLPLYIKSNDSQGISYVKTDKFGVESKLYDDKHLLLTMYKGNTASYTIIAAKVTNISSEKINIQNFELDGSYWFPFDDSGSETPLLHTFPIGKKVASQCDCFGNPYPTLESPISLGPHEYAIAYVNGTFASRDLHLNKFTANVGIRFQ